MVTTVQLTGATSVVVLIGAETSTRKWIRYEIIKGWNDGKGVLGIYIHNLLNSDSMQSIMGNNPFASIGYGNTGTMLSSIVKTYQPPYTTSTSVYEYIKSNLATWVDDAIAIRKNN